VAHCLLYEYFISNIRTIRYRVQLDAAKYTSIINESLIELLMSAEAAAAAALLRCC